jgi:hypothetical protein
MAKNTLSDLNNHLFAQLERLGEEDLSQEELKKEIERSKAINGVARNIIDNAKTTLEGVRLTYEKLPGNEPVPDQFKLKES